MLVGVHESDGGGYYDWAENQSDHTENGDAADDANKNDQAI